MMIMTFEQIKNVLAQKTVGIAGCGGLGSNCAVALVRSGLGHIVLADFDVVDLSNLNRQYYFLDQIGKRKVDALTENLLRICRRVDISRHHLRLGPCEVKEIFAGCDLIVEAFDQADMKAMLIDTVLGEMPGIPLVVGNGMAGWGRNNSIRTLHTGENLYVCGDNESDIENGDPPLAPRVGVVSMMQANTALQILLGKVNTEQL